MAAGYEFEYNENITAARGAMPLRTRVRCVCVCVTYPRFFSTCGAALMERALRLNPKSERLWIEFCKLECIYLARIKERMEEFGIDASALVPKVLPVMSELPCSVLMSVSHVVRPRS